jgi:hypothetical protein
MIASRDSDFYFELCLGANVFAKQLVVSSKIASLSIGPSSSQGVVTACSRT